MRRLVTAVVVASASLTCAVSQILAASPSGSSASPYPAQLELQRGLTMSNIDPAPPWGTVLSASQAGMVTIRSHGPTFEWGVWSKPGRASEYPVRSSDGGAHWALAGPLLASDWAGGALYYVSKVIPESSSAVVMVSNAIIDVTTDAGRHWFQYFHAPSNWSISGHASVGGKISIRVAPPSWANLPEASYANYTLDLSHLQWRRVTESLTSMSTPACRVNDLTVHGGRYCAPFQTVEGSVVVVNVSTTRCVVHIVARISLLESDGVRLNVREPSPAKSDISKLLPARGSATLILT